MKMSRYPSTTVNTGTNWIEKVACPEEAPPLISSAYMGRKIHQGKALHQQKDCDSPKAQMMISIFSD